VHISYFTSEPALTYGGSDLVWFMAFYVTFNNIWVISWKSAETGENHRSVVSHWQT